MRPSRLLTFVTTTLLLLTGSAIHAQTTIVNLYTPVTAIESGTCGDMLTVENAASFAPGILVMIHQAQGAAIDSSNTPAYGTVTDYRSAGLYELNRIAAISGNTIYLQFRLVNGYQIAGKVQLIHVPEYEDVTVKGTLTCKPWDGRSGGVLAIKASGTVTLEGNIDVRGTGYRGAGSVQSSQLPAFTVTDYVGPNKPGSYGAKGEGMTGYGMPGLEYGRGAPANGGGAGGNHNAGGGGGGGAEGCGGPGGGGYQPGYLGDAKTAFGVGGRGSFVDGERRIWMGGGGGAGHDNNGVGTDGVEGGGIVIIDAPSIVGNGHTISAHGQDVAGATYDGAGGGGGGGMIWLTAASVHGALTLDVAGGNGGDAGYPALSQQTGPGGGGGGGYIRLSAVVNLGSIVTNAGGGIAGKALVVGGNYGAGNGCDGLVSQDARQLVTATVPGSVASVQASADTTVICGSPARLRASITTGAGTLSWSPAEDLSDSTAPDPIARPRTDTRYVVTLRTLDGCVTSDTVDVSVTMPAAAAIPDTSVGCGTPIQLWAEIFPADPGATYRWSPADRLSDPSAPDPIARPGRTTTYTVTVTSAGGCEATTQVRVEVLQTSDVEAVIDGSDGVESLDTTRFLIERCDSITLRNFSDAPFLIEDASCLRNLEISVPPAQFPLTIPARGERHVLVCYRPIEVGDDRDTLILSGDCDLVIPLRITATQLLLAGSDKCGTDLRARLVGMEGSILKSALPYPNPASTAVSIQLRRRSEQEPAPIHCALFDASGNRVGDATLAADASSPDAPSDRDRYTVDVGELPSGLYYLNVERGGERRSFPVVVAR